MSRDQGQAINRLHKSRALIDIQQTTRQCVPGTSTLQLVANLILSRLGQPFLPYEQDIFDGPPRPSKVTSPLRAYGTGAVVVVVSLEGRRRPS